MMHRHGIWAGLIVGLLLALAPAAARADPTQEDVFRGIQNGVGHEDSISGRGMVAFGCVVGGIVIVAVVVTRRQNVRAMANGGWGSASVPSPTGKRRSAGPANHPGKLVRELMKEAGLTRAQIRQLESLNARLADDGREVKHLATLLLCPSLIAAARPESIVRAA